MGASRILRALLVASAFLVLVLGAEAQGKHGKGKGKAGGAPKAAGKAPGKGVAPARPQSIPGFDTPAAGAKGKGKAKNPKAAQGKRPQAGAQKPAAPADPMTEADRVAAEAEVRAELESVDEKRLRELFQLCDLDQNGWISLREAELVLSFDRTEYRRADTDQDGRLVAREYSAQKLLVFARLGAPSEAERAAEAARANRPAKVEPKAPAPAIEAPASAPIDAPAKGARRALAGLSLPGIFPRPSDLLQRYDQDASQGLAVTEVERLLTDLGLDLSSPLVVAQMDPDKSGQLEALELVPLSLLASRHMPEALRPEPRSAPAEARETTTEAAPAPERPKVSALEALTPFGRLDRDHDGFVDERDMRAMQGVARLDARLNALLSALDADGDHRLSRAEFERSMTNAPATSEPAPGSDGR